jgi:hypothetical protein
MSSIKGNIVAGNVSINTNNSSINSPSDIYGQIITKANLMTLIWFLAIYLVVYFIIQLLTGGTGSSNSVIRVFDLVALICIIIYLVNALFYQDANTQKQNSKELYQSFKDYVNNPITLFSVGLFIVLFYLMIYMIGIPMNKLEKPFTVAIIENAALLMFVLTMVVVFFRMILGVSLTDMLDKWLNSIPDTSPSTSGNTLMRGNTVSASSSSVYSTSGNEVFNIKNNIYTYDDAQTVCASYGARLATYPEVEAAYNNGGEWCNYGWSEGQMALFPTQQTTWDKLQKTKNNKNACGRPGINGGYIDDTKIRFGINCFGKKPKPSTQDLAALSANTNSIANVPKSQEDIILEKKIQFWKDNADKLIQVNSYNNTKWSSV